MKKTKVNVHKDRDLVTLTIPDVGLMRVFHDGGLVQVGTADIRPGHIRKGAGTKLYEAAFEEACRHGKTLVSDAMRSAYAEAFWRKQQRKGRAVCRQPGRGSYYKGPLETLAKNLYAQCLRDLKDADKAELCAKARFRSATSELPAVSVDADGQFWPCYQWALDPKKCGGSLDGLKRRRRG